MKDILIEACKDVFAQDNRIKLCKINDSDRNAYIELQKENALSKSAFKDKEFEDLLWEDYIDDKAFYVSIKNLEDDEYIGYCGIKNTKKEEWELAIELFKRFQSMGYGTAALQLFMNQVNTVAGKRVYIAKVDGENIKSQKMFEKLGARPAGIVENLLHDKAYMEEYEKTYASEVSDVMRETAKRFDVEPEKLLTHVLCYKFF